MPYLWRARDEVYANTFHRLVTPTQAGIQS
jgi:hypothetical protein